MGGEGWEGHVSGREERRGTCEWRGGGHVSGGEGDM